MAFKKYLIMEYNQIYTFGNKDIRGSYHSIQINNEVIIDKVELLRGESDIDVPIKFGYLTGKNIYDLVGTGYSPLYLLSDNITNLLRDHKIIGWKTYPTMLYDRKGKEVKGYSIFSITGRCGPVDWSKSEKFVKDPFVPGGRAANMLRGLYPNMDIWDGSDVFMPNDDSLYIFLTKKVRDLLIKNEATNILMEKVTEKEMLEPLPLEIDSETEAKIHRIFGVK